MGRRIGTQRLRIIVTGLIAQHPSLGGVAWDYVQYPAGLRQLGHDVYYVEDSGEWPYTPDGGPSGNDWIAGDCRANVKHLSAVMDRFGLGERWAYRFPIEPRWFGMSDVRRREVTRTADLLINISGSLERPTEYRSVRRLAYVDSDPVFTQIKLALPRRHLEFQKRVAVHDVHFSFGERPSGSVPDGGYCWLPTRQPILLSEWGASPQYRNTYTTVMNWTSYRPLRYRGRVYAQKDTEFLRFVDLPSHLPRVDLEVAMSHTEHASWQSAALEERGPGSLSQGQSVIGTLAQRGWKIVDPLRICSGLDDYRSYIEGSKAEWSVAKNGYVQGRPAWFSCRSACYLAAARPVVVQDTGFSDVIPVGSGLFAFSTLEEAVAAICEVESSYLRHSSAAREIAEAYFDCRVVLAQLIEGAMQTALRQGGGNS